MQSAKATGSPADPLVVVAVSLIPQDRFVTKGHHVNTIWVPLI